MKAKKIPALYTAHEFQVISMREWPLPHGRVVCDVPRKAAHYWREYVRMHPYFNRDVECLTVIMLDSRRRVQGHQLVSLGTLDTLLVQPREVFRAAVIMNAAAVIVVHNHPSGDPTPSEADIKGTRDLIRAGQILKIDVLDHLVMGAGDDCVSLRDMGYFYA